MPEPTRILYSSNGARSPAADAGAFIDKIGGTVSPSLESRIAALARRDRILAITFTVLMWLVLVPLCMAAASVAPSTGITVALVVSMLLLALFNTASTLAMLRRYALSRDEIYRPDIMNADLARQQGRR